MKNGREFILMLILIAVFVAMNYNHLDSFVINNFSNEKIIQVERVIDGDTIVDSDELHYRMLGINNKSV